MSKLDLEKYNGTKTIEEIAEAENVTIEEVIDSMVKDVIDEYGDDALEFVTRCRAAGMSEEQITAQWMARFKKK